VLTITDYFKNMVARLRHVQILLSLNKSQEKLIFGKFIKKITLIGKFFKAVNNFFFKLISSKKNFITNFLL